MEEISKLKVRRVRPSDVERIAAFVNRARPHGPPVTPDDVLERLGTAGFFLAEHGGAVVGLLGWRAEDLVARVTDFLIYPARFRVSAGRALLSAMEDAARELQCEAAILFVPIKTPLETLNFWETFGYELRKVAALPRPWREAAREANPTGEWVVLKQLREDRVVRPI
ncbi:MAG TPA: GNAT family N-acetyltransferase [Chloroflexi bacterium]|nr:GNAT family N-acetyltransferase [Chloroflexota bacterium]